MSIYTTQKIDDLESDEKKLNMICNLKIRKRNIKMARSSSIS